MSRESLLQRALKWTLAAVAVLALVQLAATMLVRFRYPFELEWMEGGSLDHVRRILESRPLYGPPSLDFTPFVYPPLYYYVAAPIVALLGKGILGARLVSLLAATGSLFLVASFVRREGQDWRAALVAAGLFAASYGATGFFFDLARVDALMLLFALAGCWLARFGRSILTGVLAALVLVAACLTKQAAMVLSLPALVVAFRSGRRRGLVVAGAFVAFLVGAIVVFDRTSGGWFSYFVFTLPGQHQIFWHRWAAAIGMLLVSAAPLLVLAFLLLRDLAVRGGESWLFYALLAGCWIGVSLLSLLHSQGYVNVMLPAYAALSITAGLALTRAPDDAGSGPRWLARALPFALPLIGLLGFACLAYDHRRAIPTDADSRATHRALVRLQESGGNALVLGSSISASLASRRAPSAHAMALADVLRGARGPAQALLGDLLRILRERRYDAVILEQGLDVLPPIIRVEMQSAYRFRERLFDASDADRAWPRSGFRTRPEELWVRR